MATLGNPQETIAVLKKYGFNFQKKFGQNFLIDPHVLDKIIAEGLGLYQTEELINNILNPDETKDISEPEQEIVKPIRKSAIGDIKLFSNSLSKLLITMQNAGITANSRKHETDKYIEYKVRIFKNPPQYDQLKIC